MKLLVRTTILLSVFRLGCHGMPMLGNSTQGTNDNLGTRFYHRIGNLTQLKIEKDDDGFQVCRTKIVIQLYDDKVPKVFQDPYCHEKDNLANDETDSSRTNHIRRRQLHPIKEPTTASTAQRNAQLGAFRGKSVDGSTLNLIMRNGTAFPNSMVVASVNEFATGILYHIFSDRNGDLLVTETHVNHLLPEGQPEMAVPAIREDDHEASSHRQNLRDLLIGKGDDEPPKPGPQLPPISRQPMYPRPGNGLIGDVPNVGGIGNSNNTGIPRDEGAVQLPGGNSNEENTSNGGHSARPASLYSVTSYELQSTTIDLMVVWTKQAECKNSNQVECSVDSFTEAHMRLLVDLAVQETNEAFEASGITTQLRLVHAYRHPTYVEATGGNESLSALYDITDPHNGILDDVHPVRTAVRADMVSFLIDASDLCGVAWLGPSKNHTFSVTNWMCATGGYTFGHGLGQNLGCHSDRGTVGECDASEGYGYGYRDPEARFRSILAQNCNSRECDDNAGGGCLRANMYSTPDYLYNNSTIGTSESNCARQINRISPIVAGYFDEMASPDFRADAPAETYLFAPPSSPPSSAPPSSE